jgi:lauroyl/myristoyl acyltransferase
VTDEPAEQAAGVPRDRERPPAPEGPRARGRGKRLEAPHRRVARDRRLRERIAVRGYRAGRWILGRLPAGPTDRVGGWLAVASYWAWPEKRHIVRANCATVLGCPEGDRRVGHLAREVYRNQTRWVLEMMRLSRTMRNPKLPWFSPEAAETLDRYWRTEGALVIAGLHLGNNEAAAATLAGRGLPVNVVADDTAYDELFAELAAERRSWGVTLVPWRNLRAVFRVLRSREILGLLVDWGYRPQDVPVRLLGEWTTFPGGPAVLAAKTGAAIAPFWVIRRPDGNLDGKVLDLIRVASTDPAEIQRATQALADELGDGIRRAPGQWCVFKPMWPADPAERRRLAQMAAGTAPLALDGAGPAEPAADP